MTSALSVSLTGHAETLSAPAETVTESQRPVLQEPPARHAGEPVDDDRRVVIALGPERSRHRLGDSSGGARDSLRRRRLVDTRTRGPPFIAKAMMASLCSDIGLHQRVDAGVDERGGRGRETGRVMAAPTVTRGCERACRGSDRRRGSSARCSKHASRFFDAETPSARPAERPFFPSSLGAGDATTYGPALGARFLTRDPLASVTREPYAYASNDPVNNVDPTGLDTCGRPKGVLGLVGSAIDCIANPTEIVDQTEEAVQEANEHVTVQPQVCVGYCVGFTYNHGRIYFNRGWGGFMLPGVSGGWTTTPYDEVEDPCFDGVESYYGPGFGVSGNEEYSEYQVGYGLGIALLYRNKTTELVTLPGFG